MTDSDARRCPAAQGPMPVESLEAILEVLPDPTLLTVEVHREDFDYSRPIEQATEAAPGITISEPHYLSGQVENPSKKTIVDIYRKEQEKRDEHRKIIVSMQGVHWSKYVKLPSICLNQTTLTPQGIDVYYRPGHKPDYLDKLTEVASQHKVKIEVRSFFNLNF